MVMISFCRKTDVTSESELNDFSDRTVREITSFLSLPSPALLPQIKPCSLSFYGNLSGQSFLSIIDPRQFEAAGCWAGYKSL